MIQKKLLSILILSSFSQMVFSEIATKDKNEPLATITNEILDNVVITKEEAFYIHSECQQFAVDDEIEAKFVDDYIKLCSYELTQAVKTAKYRMKNKKPEITAPTNSNDPSKPKPL